MLYELNRNVTGRDQLQSIIRSFYQRHSSLPDQVIVHCETTEGTKSDLESMDLNLPVETTGGCLAGEVWLGIDKFRKEKNDEQEKPEH